MIEVSLFTVIVHCEVYNVMECLICHACVILTSKSKMTAIGHVKNKEFYKLISYAPHKLFD